MSNKLSVIIPVYPNFDLLDRCLNSLKDQNVSNIQTICVVDGFRSMIREDFLRKEYEDLNISFIHHENNKSALQARLTGCDYISGEYVAFLDKDDELEIGLYNRALQYFTNDIDIVGFSITNRDVNFIGECKNNLECVWNFHQKINKSLCSIAPYIFRKNLIKKSIKDLKLSRDLYINYTEDVILLMGFLCNASKMIENSEIGTYIYHSDNTESTCNLMRNNKDIYNLRKKDIKVTKKIIIDYMFNKKITKSHIKYKENGMGVPIYNGVKPIFS